MADRENIDELHLMASDKKFIFNIDDYQQLVEKSQDIMSVVCESGKEIYLDINKFFIGSKISKGVFVLFKTKVIVLPQKSLPVAVMYSRPTMNYFRFSYVKSI